VARSFVGTTVVLLILAEAYGKWSHLIIKLICANCTPEMWRILWQHCLSARRQRNEN